MSKSSEWALEVQQAEEEMQRREDEHFKYWEPPVPTEDDYLMQANEKTN